MKVACIIEARMSLYQVSKLLNISISLLYQQAEVLLDKMILEEV